MLVDTQANTQAITQERCITKCTPSKQHYITDNLTSVAECVRLITRSCLSLGSALTLHSAPSIHIANHKLNYVKHRKSGFGFCLTSAFN